MFPGPRRGTCCVAAENLGCFVVFEPRDTPNFEPRKFFGGTYVFVIKAFQVGHALTQRSPIPGAATDLAPIRGRGSGSATHPAQHVIKHKGPQDGYRESALAR